jgi:hypothetical protein
MPLHSPDPRRKLDGLGLVQFSVDLRHVGPRMPEHQLSGFQPELLPQPGRGCVSELMRAPGVLVLPDFRFLAAQPGVGLSEYRVWYGKRLRASPGNGPTV